MNLRIIPPRIGEPVIRATIGLLDFVLTSLARYLDWAEDLPWLRRFVFYNGPAIIVGSTIGFGLMKLLDALWP